MKNQKPFHYLFFGCSGSGKTYLSRIIMRFLTANGCEVGFIESRLVYRDYLRLLDSKVSDKSEALKKCRLTYCKKYAILDDIGNELPDTEKAAEFIGGLILERYERIKKSLICGSIITTNLDIVGLRSRYGERILDRIYEHYIFMSFNEKSFRAQNARIVRG